MSTAVRGALDLVKHEIEALVDHEAQVIALGAAAELAELGAYCMARAASGQAVARVILIAAELQHIAERCSRHGEPREAASGL